MVSRPTSPTLTALMLGSALALSACTSSGPLDWDLRSRDSTADAARQATANRPSADARGIISYPDYQVAVAARGDTVAGVAARVGVSPEELASTNALQATDPLRQGEVLLLPRRVAAAAPAGGFGGASGPVDVSAIATTALDRVGPSPTTATPAPAPVVRGTEPVRHKVARGETAFTIARTYNVSAKALAEWNGLGPDLGVREGQTLIIPVANGPAPVLETVVTPPGSGSPTPEPPSAKTPLPDEKTAPAAQKPKETPASPDLGADRTAASSPKFVMPVQGNIIRAYVKKKNEGIGIAAAAGAPVKAAAGGTVAAITKDTDQVPIIVIRHDGGLLTVYAGVDGLKVKKGDPVSAGQTIAVVRQANPSFLHFEVRRGVESLDPAGFLQ
ncbi:MAG: M23 family metallopeptidase [Pseudomonadota bacterium]